MFGCYEAGREGEHMVSGGDEFCRTRRKVQKIESVVIMLLNQMTIERWLANMLISVFFVQI